MSSMNRTTASPPSILSVEDMLAKMRSGTKELHEIRMREMVFPVRVLSIDEVTAIRRDAISRTNASGGDDTECSVVVQKLTLKLASTVTHGGAPLMGDKLLSTLHLDELQYLYEEYIRVMDSVNPTLQSIPPEKFRELVDGLKKNTASSKDCSLLQLRAICSAFVDLIQRPEIQDLLQGKSSGGPPAA